MWINWQTIITAGGVVSAVSLLIGVIVKAHNLIIEIKNSKKEMLEIKNDFEHKVSQTQTDFEKRISDLEKHHNDDMHRVNEENCLICFALSACLDGLQQLGANHEVPEAKEKLDKFLNKQAHI